MAALNEAAHATYNHFGKRKELKIGVLPFFLFSSFYDLFNSLYNDFLTLLRVRSALFDAVRFVVAGEGEDEPHERFEVAVGQVTRRYGRSPHALRR